MLNLNFSEFIQRLEKIPQQRLPTALLEAVSAADLYRLIQSCLSDKNLLQQLAKLSPNQNIRLNKRESGLVRTVTIGCTPDAQYYFMLESKSKNAQHQKRKVEKFAGGFKRGKTAWRLDSPAGPEAYISLVQELAHPEQSTELLKEVLFAWEQVDSPFLQRALFGGEYQHRGQSSVCIYSRKGINLHKLIAQAKLSPAQCDTISLQLLSGLRDCHQVGRIHQDIKPENILIFFDKDGNILAKYNDFGNQTNLHKSGHALSTVSFESPEIAWIALQNKTAYYLDHYRKYGKSLGCLCISQMQLSVEKNKLSQLAEFYQQPYFANDVWACGITLYMLYFRQLPLALPTGERFGSLLNPQRDKRFSAQQALLLWERKLGHRLNAHYQLEALPGANLPKRSSIELKAPSSNFICVPNPIALYYSAKQKLYQKITQAKNHCIHYTCSWMQYSIELLKNQVTPLTLNAAPAKPLLFQPQVKIKAANARKHYLAYR